MGVERTGIGRPAIQRYARGFLISSDVGCAPVDEWLVDRAAGLQIAHSPQLPLTMASHGGALVAVLGLLVDTATWSSPVSAVELAAAALARSEGEFLDVTDAWSGRYLILYRDGHGRHVMTDATGMRTAFFALRPGSPVASHARLVASAVDAGVSPIAAAYTAFARDQPSGLVLPRPGRSTPWQDVVALTANTVLDLDAGQVRRIFPRRPIAARTVPVAAARVAPLLSRQVDALVATGRPVVVSLTAGRDSRVTLAATRRQREQLEYFTYRMPDRWGTCWDAESATNMAKELALRHRVLEIDRHGVSPQLAAAIGEATTLSHGRPLVAAYRSGFPPDAIHIRSNVGEVGRAFYRRRRGPEPLTAEKAARLWAGTRTVPGLIVESFEEWIRAVRLASVTEADQDDLFYWEHRLATWHGNIVCESDFAFDTHVLFNSRVVLSEMLGVPREDRRRGTLFRGLVDELWPEVGVWPHKPTSIHARIRTARRRVATAERLVRERLRARQHS